MTTPENIDQAEIKEWRNQVVHRIRLDVLNLVDDIRKHPSDYENYRMLLLEISGAVFDSTTIISEARNDV